MGIPVAFLRDAVPCWSVFWLHSGFLCVAFEWESIRDRFHPPWPDLGSRLSSHLPSAALAASQLPTLSGSNWWPIFVRAGSRWPTPASVAGRRHPEDHSRRNRGAHFSGDSHPWPVGLAGCGQAGPGGWV